MTRISQLSKELGMSNADLIDVLKNRMGLVDKKSHSSALSDDQVTEVKKILQSGNSATSPKAIGKPPVKVTKKTLPPTTEVEASKPAKPILKKASPPVSEDVIAAPESKATESTLEHPVSSIPAPSSVKALPPRLVLPQTSKPQPQSTATVKLQTATNTSKGEVKHGSGPTGRPKYLPPRGEIGVYKPDTTSIIKISQNTPPSERKDLGRITLPTPRAPGSGRPGMGSGRPGGPGGRPGSRPGMGSGRPGGPGGRPGSRPGMGSGRPGGPGGRPGINIPTGPVDPATLKGPGRSLSIGGRKKKKEIQEAEEMELKLRQPHSRVKEIAEEYIQDEIGIVMLSEGVTVKELAEKCKRPAKDVMAKLFHRGILATINQPLDTELAKEIAREFGYLSDIVSFEEDVQIIAEEAEIQGDKTPRAPVVTIMGHVDHGKTSLLDAIRETKVASGEKGGITQNIGAYHVEVKDKNTQTSRRIVFIDTPGHEAFTKMRARGAKVTDIAILVVAADDGVMPQTIESINHAKAANVPIIVAINKMDKAGANPDKVQQGLLQYSIQTETYGGDVPSVSVSAKTKLGLDELLETILLVADLKDLKAVVDAAASGSILEGRLDKGRGAVATVLVQQGTLREGEIFIAGSTMGRVRAMFDDRGKRLKEAGPSSAVQILGFEEVPAAGDKFQIVESEDKARNIVGFRQEKAKQDSLRKQRVTLENIFSTIKEGQIKELPLIIKADTQGSVESLSGQLEALSTDKIRVRLLHTAVGTVNENDVLLAEASKAIVIGFNTKAERKAAELAKDEGVDLRFHEVIYRVTEEIQAAMIGLLDTTEKETFLGRAEIRQLFKSGKLVIAGSFVTEGKVNRGAQVRVLREKEVVFTGKLISLKRFKDDVSEVKNGLDCGIGIDGYNQVAEGDLLEFFTTEKVVATSLN
jgi:translation initiation factor IF-2